MGENSDYIGAEGSLVMMFAIYASLMCLALGLFTSMTFLALTHIFILVPCLYFIPRTNFKAWNKSAWFLLGLIVAIVISIVVNQDIMVLGYKSLTKSKYYIIGLLSIVPYTYWFVKTSESEEAKIKKIQYLLWAFFFATTIASISGMMGVFVGLNPLKMKVGFVDRNGGLAGMLMNYAHNLSYFQIIITGMIVCREEIKKYINLNLLYAIFAINLIGLYTTYTRGAWLAFLIGIPFFFFKNHKKSFLLTFFLLLVLGVGAYKIAGKAVIRPASDIERTSMWKTAIVGFKERPVFGLGYLNFEQLSTSLKRKYDIEVPKFGGHAHNNFLEMLASTGLVGFLCFSGWLLFWFLEVLKRDDVIAKIAVPYIVVFIVSGLTQATFVLGANLFFIMTIYALTQIDYRVLKKA